MTSGKKASRRWQLLSALALVFALVAAGTATSTAPAEAKTSYPTWSQLQRAKHSKNAKAAQVKRITQLVQKLKHDASVAQSRAKKAGEALAAAQDKFAEADRNYNTLQKQADDLKAQADLATKKAGLLAASLYRTGGADLTTSLLLSDSAESTDDLLASLGSTSLLVRQQTDVYKEAETLKNAADAAADQAKSARKVRAAAQKKADDAFAAATEASNAAQKALDEENAHVDVLQAQLHFLKARYAKTAQEYQKGVAAERERKRQELLRQQRLAQAQGGPVSSSGWVVPVVGPITSPFGPRVAPCYGCSYYHMGDDIAAAGGTVIRAAHAGTVVYAGWNGDYGNFVMIDDGDGVATAYGHIMNGGYLVHYGQHVVAGQGIARVGTTGHSTGYHLHFEVRINGVQVDPYPWMANHGARLGY